MKTKKIFLFMLLMTMSMVANATTDYGFKIGRDGTTLAITSDNYLTASQGQPWSYDPDQKVLYLTDGSIYGSYNTLEIDSDKNPTLKICVQGDCTLTGDVYHNIEFSGEGQHIIYGDGKLSLSSSKTGSKGIRSKGNTSLTIKDITLNITAYGGYGIDSNDGFNAITIDHCAVSIVTGRGTAWMNDGTTTTVRFPRCHIVNGSFYYTPNGGIFTGNNWAHDATIKRSLYDFNVTVAEPVVGGTVSNSCQVNGTDYVVNSCLWNKISNGGTSRVQEGSAFMLGYAYQVAVVLFPNDGEQIANKEDCIVTVNGNAAEIYNCGSHFINITYTFPQLANTYYDLWIGGKQVNDINQNDVLEDGGSVRYKKLLGLHYLYLNNANIKNTGNSQLESTAYGRGIYSTLSGLSISVKGDNSIESTGEGIYFTGNLSLLGGSDTENTLNIKGSSGIKTNSQGTALQVYNMKLTAEATSSDSGIGIGGTPSFSSNNMNCTMTVSGAKTVVKASGQYLSLGRLKDLVFEDGLQIVRPSGAYFGNNNVRDASGSVICGPWVVIMGDASITTGLNEVSPLENGQGESVKGQRDERYNLSGQRVGKDYKGIVIHNGKKVVR